jgi:hypothetical protein
MNFANVICGYLSIKTTTHDVQIYFTIFALRLVFVSFFLIIHIRSFGYLYSFLHRLTNIYGLDEISICPDKIRFAVLTRRILTLIIYIYIYLSIYLFFFFYRSLHKSKRKL